MNEQCGQVANKPNPGRKLDTGKLPIMDGVFKYFPRALQAVAQVSEYGALKYDWNNWQHLEDGPRRYGNAHGRHILNMAIDGDYDPESGLLHEAQQAWNVLARLELRLRSGELKIKPFTPPKAKQQPPKEFLTGLTTYPTHKNEPEW